MLVRLVPKKTSRKHRSFKVRITTEYLTRETNSRIEYGKSFVRVSCHGCVNVRKLVDKRDLETKEV